MLERGTTPADYMLRIAAEEIEYMEKAELSALPHVSALLHHPVTRFLFQHLQNLCWTLERVWRRCGAAGLPEGTVRRQHLHPCLTDEAVAAPRGTRPHIWIDITNTYRTGFGGGIGRVALQLADAAIKTGLAIPVVMENGCIHEYFKGPGRGDALSFDADTIYVLVDSFWQQIEEYRAVCARAHACGAKIVTCIHDVIPLYYPSLSQSEFVDRFAYSFEEMIEVSDACIAVSGYSCRKVEAAIADFRLRRGRPLPVTYFHLGADGHVNGNDSEVRDNIRDVFAAPHVFLSVGTLEPRKGYAVTLDAFDDLWRRGIGCDLVILGRPGWISKSLQRRIVEHPRNGKTLHWIVDASDAELTYAYRAAYCVIQASVTEGFGLPIVEATREGTPVIATDNEIFRELGGDEMVYFKRCDSTDLAARVEEALARRPRVGHLELLRWDQSLDQMVSRISRMVDQPAM